MQMTVTFNVCISIQDSINTRNTANNRAQAVYSLILDGRHAEYMIDCRFHMGDIQGWFANLHVYVVCFESSASYGYLNSSLSPRVPEDTRNIPIGSISDILSSFF